MAAEVYDLINIIDSLTIKNSNVCKPTMNVKLKVNKAELNQIKKTYESIFSWDIDEQTDTQKRDIILSVYDKVQEECQVIGENEFDLKRFSLQLVICYEQYTEVNYEKSLQEIEGAIKYLKLCEFDDEHKQYLCVYNHIARATYAYVALTMDLDSKTMVENVKPMDDFEPAEMAAACVVKAHVFMQYPPVGNDIGLKFASRARALRPDDLEWLHVWLTAKGRVRRYWNYYIKPDECEIKAADVLLHAKHQKAVYLINAFDVYENLGTYYRYNSQMNVSAMYYKTALDIAKKSMPLLASKTQYLNSIFSRLVYFPKEFQLKSLFNDFIEKLKFSNNGYSDQLLGKYYCRVERDYKTAKVYLSRKIVTRGFSQVMELLKVECNLHSIHQFPYIETLNKIFDVFPTPKRRLMVTVQMLMYYYYKDEPKEFMRCLKLYLDIHYDDIQKKQFILNAHSIPPLPIYSKSFQFLNMIKMYVERIANHNLEWTREEKTTLDETSLRFVQMFRVNIDTVESNGSHPNCTSSKSADENNANRIGADKQKQPQQQHYGLNEKPPGSWRQRGGSTERPAATPNDPREWRSSRNRLDSFSGRQNAREVVNSSWRCKKGEIPKEP